VIWDSHPLALGATPTQVFVDGLPQFQAAHKIEKPANYQKLPKVPTFDKEAEAAVRYEGLPPLEPRKAKPTTVFVNVKNVYQPSGNMGVHETFTTQMGAELGIVVVQNGLITCSGSGQSCLTDGLRTSSEVNTIDLEGGSISPGFTSYGSPLGLEAVNQEPSTNDGLVLDPLVKPVPKVLGNDFILAHAADGLQFGTRDALYVVSCRFKL